MRPSPFIRALGCAILWLGLVAACGHAVRAAQNYTDPAGYPAAWPAQLNTQAYTAQGQVQSDVSGSISSQQDPSHNATPQSSVDFSSGPLNAASSFNYYANGSVLFFRIRLAGPPQALTGNGQPFDSATWNFL
ncbi:MAG: hypothetical protein AB1813_05265, partial [Verrucomicrobiota bacterium]